MSIALHLNYPMPGSDSNCKALPVRYKTVQLDCGYRVDCIVEQKLILELKAVNSLLPIHEAQLLTYMRLATISTGLLTISMSQN